MLPGLARVRGLVPVIAALLASVGMASEPHPTTDLVQGGNTFAFELYARLANEPGNVFFSPFSVHSAVAMAYAGARKATAREMARVLHYPEGPETLGGTYGAVLRDLRAEPPTVDSLKRSDLAVANSLWGNPGMRIRPEFAAGIMRDYGGTVRWLDFGRSQAASDTINGWVSAATHGRITELVPVEALNESTVSVLVNAVYFHGRWERPFDQEWTRPAPFHFTSEASISVPTMSQTLWTKYAETPDLQLLELPYADHRLSMIVLLPRRMDGLASLEDSLDGERVSGWLARRGVREVEVHLPRFTFSVGRRLNGPLMEMGMRLAFDSGRADFTGMTPLDNVFISAVFHQAFVAVDEQGTEAAAATAVLHMRGGLATAGPPPIMFQADHPFVFLIRDTRSGSILFLGRVADPR
jgi:serpin B